MARPSTPGGPQSLRATAGREGWSPRELRSRTESGVQADSLPHNPGDQHFCNVGDLRIALWSTVWSTAGGSQHPVEDLGGDVTVVAEPVGVDPAHRLHGVAEVTGDQVSGAPSASSIEAQKCRSVWNVKRFGARPAARSAGRQAAS